MTWSAANATSVSIDNGVGVVSGTSVTVKPAATTTYTLTAANSAGASVTAKVTVTVVAEAAIASFSASAPVLTPATTGVGSTVLSWTVTGATTVSIDNGVGTVTGTSVSVSPSATTTYTLTAANSIGGTVTATVTVQVRSNLAALNGTVYPGTGYAWGILGAGYLPCSSTFALASDAAGNIYFTDPDNDAVCKLSPSGVLTVVASDGANPLIDRENVMGGAHAAARPAVSQKSGAATKAAPANGFKAELAKLRAASAQTARPAATPDGSSNNAGLDYPYGIAVTADGKTIYIGDAGDETIRKITVASDGTGTVSLLAGTPGTSGSQDGPSAQASFDQPEGLALDANGNLYVADGENSTIRKITIASDGTANVTTVAGLAGNWGNTDGAGSTARFAWPVGLTFDQTGNLYVADCDNDRIRKIAFASNGAATVTTVSSNGNPYFFGGPIGLTIDGAGNLYVAAEWGTVSELAMASDGAVTLSNLAGSEEYSGHIDGPGASAQFEGPSGIALDAAGSLFIADEQWGFEGSGDEIATIRKLALSTDQVSTVVLNVFGGTGGSADGTGSTASFNLPAGAAVDGAGNIYIADALNSTIRKIVVSSGTATVSTLAGAPGIYGRSDGVGNQASFYDPMAVSAEADGSALYVADTGNATIREVNTATGQVTTLAGVPEYYGNQDGTGVNAEFEAPQQITARDNTGLLYVADGGVIRSVDPATGDVVTPAFKDGNGNSVSFQNAEGLAVFTTADKSKSYLYAAQRCMIYSIDLSSKVAAPLAGSTICGYQDGQGTTSALFLSDIWSLSVDSQGNVYAVELGADLVRRITPAGAVTTVAGAYGSATAATGPLPASLFMPIGIAIDPTDNLIVTVPNAVLTLVP